VVTCAPAVFFATAFAAFVSLFTTFFSRDTAFLFTPPWPEQAPRPDETEVVPSLQIVAAACALRVPADNASAVAVTVANSQFRDESMLPPRLQREEGEKMSA
jgi:hypothetical protein